MPDLPYRTIVLLQNPKYPHNVAAALRACACFGVDTLRWTGDRVVFTAGARLPREERMKGYRSVDFAREARPFDHLPLGTRVVAVEITPSAQPLTFYTHPGLFEHVAYVFGPEDGSLDGAWRAQCHEFVYIPAAHCLNLAAAVNVVLAHRSMQQLSLEHPGRFEGRGEIDVEGWEGR